MCIPERAAWDPYLPIAQLDRASGYGPEGSRFESLWGGHLERKGIMKRVSMWINYGDVVRFEEARRLIDSPIYYEAEYDQEHRDAIIKDLIENDYVICGDTHQSTDCDCIPVFDDGYIVLSMRAWAELMSEAMNIRYHNSNFTSNYMDFYMASICRYTEHYHGDDQDV